ncbi:hypothetical protein ACINK0_09710 [Deinococcus sp. VB343]|uniref:hypothetical protein n=1 Tax=Deinococcus sp. VB343 TaxID=3385567 RepID=UPI0039C9E70F
MNTPTQQPQPTAQQPQATYQAPRVQDLGAWQAVTLINSIGIDPGSAFNPANFGGNGSNNGY